MTTVIVTAATAVGWWWGCTGELTPSGISLTTGTVLGAGQPFAVHFDPPPALVAHFACGTHDFDDVAVTCGFADVPLLEEVPGRQYSHVLRAVKTGDAVQLYSVPASTALAA